MVGNMDKSTMHEIAEQAYREENLPWSVSDIAPNPDRGDEGEIHYDAFGRKYHKILVRVTPKTDSTRDSLKAEVRAFLRELKESGRL
jgi:LmbE family N-acetylglucosaminyl deacetylase